MKSEMKQYPIILSIFFIAFLIRLIGLNQSLWLDEATTARTVQTYSYSDIVTRFSPTDFHPPLHYLFMKAWTGVFGYSEIALRFPSIIFSLLTGWVVFLIGGLWAAVFFLFNPLIVYYSQEARAYMLVTFLLAVSLFFFISLFDSDESTKILSRLNSSLSLVKQKVSKNFVFSSLLIFILFIFLSIFTFYGSIFFIVPMLLYLLYKKRYKYFFVSLFVIIFSLLILSPLLYRQLINAKLSMSTVTNWKQVLGQVSIKNLVLIPIKFSFGKISFYPKMFYYLIAGVWSTFIWLKIIYGGRNHRYLLFIFFVPLVLGVIGSFVTPLLQYFRFLYLIPLMSVLLSQGINHTKVKQGVFLIFLILSFIYVLVPQFHREDWKTLVSRLPDSQPVYMVASSSDPLLYYRPSIKVIELKQLMSDNEKPPELVVIPYTADIHGISYAENLRKQGYIKETFSVRDLRWERWKKMRSIR